MILLGRKDASPSRLYDAAVEADDNPAEVLWELTRAEKGPLTGAKALATYALSWAGHVVSTSLPSRPPLRNYIGTIDKNILTYEAGCYFLFLVSHTAGDQLSKLRHYTVIADALVLHESFAELVTGWTIEGVTKRIFRVYKESPEAAVQNFASRVMSLTNLKSPTLDLNPSSQGWDEGFPAIIASAVLTEAVLGYVESYVNMLRLFVPPAIDYDAERD